MLGAEVLVTRSPGYLLDIPRDAVDVHRFERIVREAGHEPPEQRAESREKRSVLRGRPLRMFGSKTPWWPRPPGSRIACGRMGGSARGGAQLGRQSRVIGELESLVGKHPLRERPVGFLMLALYRGGGRLMRSTPTAGRVRLVEELGIDPAHELQRLEQAILRHDKELDLPEAPRKRVPASDPERRKTVTILFADLVDSTIFGARLDPEVLRRVLDRYFELVRAAIERHGGVVEKFIGDAAMAVFGIPAVHEDDALRAVRAACELREALAEPSEALTGAHGIPLQVRVESIQGKCWFALPIPANPSRPEQRSTLRLDSSRLRSRARSSSVRRHTGWCNTRSKASRWIPSTWAARWAELRSFGSAASEKPPRLEPGRPRWPGGRAGLAPGRICRRAGRAQEPCRDRARRAWHR